MYWNLRTTHDPSALSLDLDLTIEDLILELGDGWAIEDEPNEGGAVAHAAMQASTTSAPVA